ncbi:MAG: LptF/LptG family permease [Candidatus Omnitrophica bacterium]|nr:LptF/LptG family permease [Candidatus Omnitrophota bacterium]MBI2174887.1 LptF/LptG family permease [Candidatus Omnitrophota bacterium]MBI3009903.1 LptF/LptG family permease [Candidatus Omnitrophota bacterium]
MKILRAYILQEHRGPFLVTLGGLTGVLLVGNIIKFADLVVSKGVNPVDILRLLIYLVPYMLSFTVPMACLIAMILAFGRLSTDYELIAMRASGIAPSSLVWPALLMGVVISGILLVVNDRLVPTSHLAFRRQLKAIGIKQPAAYLEAGTFIKDFPPYVIFVYHVEGQKLYNVRVYQPQPEGPTRTIIADRGEFEIQPRQKNRVQLKLYDGTVDEWDPLHPGSFYKVTFSTYAMPLQPDEGSTRMSKKLKELTFKELLAERQRLVAQEIDPLPTTLELHRKIATSFSSVVFILFGLAMGLQLHHHEKLTAFVWVLAVFLAYYMATIGMNAIALKGFLPPSVSMWVPNIVGTMISGILILRTTRT